MSASSSRAIVLALSLAGLLAGCATKSDLETLQNQSYRDRQESRRTIQKLEEQLTQSQGELREEIQKSTSPVQARQANTWAELEAMRVDVAKLHEKLDTLSVKFNAMTSTTEGGPSLIDVANDVQNIKTALQSQFGMDLGGGAPAAWCTKPPDTLTPSSRAKCLKKAGVGPSSVSGVTEVSMEKPVANISGKTIQSARAAAASAAKARPRA